MLFLPNFTLIKLFNFILFSKKKFNHFKER